MQNDEETTECEPGVFPFNYCKDLCTIAQGHPKLPFGHLCYRLDNCTLRSVFTSIRS